MNLKELFKLLIYSSIIFNINTICAENTLLYEMRSKICSKYHITSENELYKNITKMKTDDEKYALLSILAEGGSSKNLLYMTPFLYDTSTFSSITTDSKRICDIVVDSLNVYYSFPFGEISSESSIYEYDIQVNKWQKKIFELSKNAFDKTRLRFEDQEPSFIKATISVDSLLKLEKYNPLYIQMLSLPEQFDGELPKQLFKCLNTEFLWINQNKLSYIPSDIGKFVKLKKLFMQQNMVSALPESFTNLINIQDIDLSRNNFTIFPKELYALKNLENINLANNKISILTNIEQLKTLNKLKTLDLSGNPIPNEVVQQLKDSVPNIKVICVGGKD